jgi:hypothetical protein
MEYTFDELKKKNVTELREIASGIEHEAVKGYTQLNKEHLLKALCESLGIEMHAHHEVIGINKSKIKAKIRELKKRRDEALSAHNHAEFEIVRRQIHRLKRTLRRAMV